jgi:hypothetical protein
MNINKSTLRCDMCDYASIDHNVLESCVSFWIQTVNNFEPNATITLIGDLTQSFTNPLGSSEVGAEISER